MNQLAGVYVIIPSLNPSNKLKPYVMDLMKEGFEHIVVVDDGSKELYRNVFEELSAYPEVTLLTHNQNQGKGAALKDAFAYCMKQEIQDFCGVVTADADGQHSPEDTKQVALSLLENPQSLILGTRDFTGTNVPKHNRMGNQITTNVIRLLYGQTIHDTQTGLRAIPVSYLEEMMRLSGNRYEFEIQVLIHAIRCKISITEVRIQTIYDDAVSESHFHVVIDSARIYGVIFGSFLKFSLSSITSAGIDIGLFTFLTEFVFTGMSLGKSVYLATIFARVVSAIYNFLINRKVVFKSEEHLLQNLLSYFVLVVVQMFCSAELVYLGTSGLGIHQLPVKIVVDILLFFLSYQIQQRFVFTKKRRL